MSDSESSYYPYSSEYERETDCPSSSASSPLSYSGAPHIRPPLFRSYTYPFDGRFFSGQTRRNILQCHEHSQSTVPHLVATKTLKSLPNLPLEWSDLRSEYTHFSIFSAASSITELIVSEFAKYGFFCPSCFVLNLTYSHHYPQFEIEAHYHRIVMMFGILVSRENDRLAVDELALETLVDVMDGARTDRLLVTALNALGLWNTKKKEGRKSALKAALHWRFRRARSVIESISVDDVQKVPRDINSRSLYLAIAMGLTLNVLRCQMEYMSAKENYKEKDMWILRMIGDAIVATNTINGKNDSFERDISLLNDRTAVKQLSSLLLTLQTEMAEETKKKVSVDLKALIKLAQCMIPEFCVREEIVCYAKKFPYGQIYSPCSSSSNVSPSDWSFGSDACSPGASSPCAGRGSVERVKRWEKTTGTYFMGGYRVQKTRSVTKFSRTFSHFIAKY
ncbi:MAG: hypothetical protein ABW189_00365 [Rickettsiales bacterium]